MKILRAHSGLELIICFAVIGTLLAIASPLVGQFSSGYRLRGAARGSGYRSSVCQAACG